MKNTKSKTKKPSWEVTNVSDDIEIPKQERKITPFNIMVGLVIIGLLWFVSTRLGKPGANLDQLKNKTIPETVSKILNNPSVKVKEIKNLKETNGVYQFDLSLDYGDNKIQSFTSYISKDGKILFQSGIKVDEVANTNAQTANNPTQAPKVSCDSMEKAQTANLTAYVVADCPFGLQMQRVFKKAISEQPALLQNLTVKYIGSISNGKITSMHGDKEAQENLRQICIREEQKAKYWEYVSCYMKEGKTDDCLAQTGVNTAGVNACMTDPNKGNKYAQADFDSAGKFGVSGSPTLILNDKNTVSEFDFGGRTADAVKQLVCCGSSAKPDFCGKELSKDSAASAFSVNDTSTNANSAANCGN